MHGTRRQHSLSARRIHSIPILWSATVHDITTTFGWLAPALSFSFSSFKAGECNAISPGSVSPVRPACVWVAWPWLSLAQTPTHLFKASPSPSGFWSIRNVSELLLIHRDSTTESLRERVESFNILHAATRATEASLQSHHPIITP